MSYRITLQPRALRNATKAGRWYEREGGVRLRERFSGEVAALIESIAEQPLLFQVIGQHPRRGAIRRAVTPVFPYSIFYCVEGDVVIVLAIQHQARRPPKFR